MQEPAEWVWVAEINMRSAGMPVSAEAFCFTSSRRGRGIMQLSTTTKPTVVSPSEIASPRALKEVFTLSAVRLTMLPFTMAGNFCGVTSTTTAPARSEGGFCGGS